MRFKTDSKKLGVHIVYNEARYSVRIPLAGVSGADIYLDRRYRGTLTPEKVTDEEFTGTLEKKAQLQEVLIYLPPYNGVKEYSVIIDDGALLLPPEDYTIKKPFVFYGSFITQGGSCARAGLAYTNILERAFDADIYNIGLASYGRGEGFMAEYIAGLDMSMFVFDYDHNAPTPEHLRATHKPFFDIVRNAHPDIPIICASRPDFYRNVPDSEVRRDIIKETVRLAEESGDKLVRFADGERMFEPFGYDLCTVDCLHPNSMGFYGMAKLIGKTASEFFRMKNTF